MVDNLMSKVASHKANAFLLHQHLARYDAWTTCYLFTCILDARVSDFPKWMRSGEANAVEVAFISCDN
ncbi:hypothetical protein NC651_010473 [Populus alba x Populus x berolinensis]|nr:hypothetical protein NC651_010473 [Populus alba x Populus x berolinensis]